MTAPDRSDRDFEAEQARHQRRMLIKRDDQRTHGTFFAIWPRKTPEGWVTCEWLHWELIPSWGWGSSAEYRYARFVPNELYDKGIRRKFWGGKAWDGPKYDPTPEGIAGTAQFMTPPDPQKFCKNFRTNGPTPCHYPHCKRRDEHGVERCGVDNIAFGEN